MVKHGGLNVQKPLCSPCRPPVLFFGASAQGTRARAPLPHIPTVPTGHPERWGLGSGNGCAMAMPGPFPSCQMSAMM